MCENILFVLLNLPINGNRKTKATWNTTVYVLTKEV